MLKKEELDRNADNPSQVSSEISLLDYIEEQSQLEEEARESLPYSFNHCTHDRRLRQPLYVCKTCSPANKEPQKGAICYSCSIQCHGEHELIELFCKRNFRCDCGTDRLGIEMCKIRKEWSPIDPDNQYNHNFDGKFCWCDIEYDPTVDERTMFQCLLCEDWFHDHCIGIDNIPNDMDFDLFICRTCVKKESWLKKYIHVKGFYWNKNKEKEIDQEKLQKNVEGMVINENMNSKALDFYDNKKREGDVDNSTEVSIKRSKTDEYISVPCSWAALPLGPEEDISLFLSNDFRLYMCHCVQCLSLAAKNPILLAEEETYEPSEDSDNENLNLMDAGLRALNSLPRVQAIEGIIAYNHIKDELSKFLRPYAEEGKVVTENAIREFFEKQKEEKASDTLFKMYKDASFKSQ
ncbi:hypothetical protein PCANB_000047 [Pneumocystis canis]|nr:hypothetical protein PCANB_000047 [Pneumocystis canis]